MFHGTHPNLKGSTIIPEKSLNNPTLGGNGIQQTKLTVKKPQ